MLDCKPDTASNWVRRATQARLSVVVFNMPYIMYSTRSRNTSANPMAVGVLAWLAAQIFNLLYRRLPVFLNTFISDLSSTTYKVCLSIYAMVYATDCAL
jgi:hypothetical protein